MVVYIKTEEDKEKLIQWFVKNRNIGKNRENSFREIYRKGDLVHTVFYECTTYKEEYCMDFKIYDVEDFLYRHMTLKEKIKKFLGGVYEFIKRN